MAGQSGEVDACRLDPPTVCAAASVLWEFEHMPCACFLVSDKSGAFAT